MSYHTVVFGQYDFENRYSSQDYWLTFFLSRLQPLQPRYDGTPGMARVNFLRHNFPRDSLACMQLRMRWLSFLNCRVRLGSKT